MLSVLRARSDLPAISYTRGTTGSDIRYSGDLEFERLAIPVEVIRNSCVPPELTYGCRGDTRSVDNFILHGGELTRIPPERLNAENAGC